MAVKGHASGSGPKREHPSLRLLKSVDGKHDSSWRKIEQVPPFNRYCPEKPDDLTHLAAKHWDDITPELIRASLLTPHNIGTLVMLCETWSRYKEAQAAVIREGLVEIDPKGGTKRNPMLLTVENSITQYKSLAQEFGLTPASEIKLGNKDHEPQGSNPYADKPNWESDTSTQGSKT